MSTLRTTTIATANGATSVPVDTIINGSAKAWVNFNGTGAVAIRGSFNVTSIRDNDTGDYTVNFADALVNTDFNITVCGGVVIDNSNTIARTTTSVSIRTFNPGATGSNPGDQVFISVSVFR